MVSNSLISKPLVCIISDIFLFRWHPPAISGQKKSIKFWNLATPLSGDFPCSENNKLPPGFRTRFISWREASGFGIEHRVYVDIAVSTELSSNGIDSAVVSKNSISMLFLFAFFLAISFNSFEGSTPITLSTFDES